MITCTFQRDTCCNLTGFEISGHAGYGCAGDDIVCSAVSALAQTALLGLLEYVPKEVVYQLDDGFLSVHLKKSSQSSHIILHTMELGLQHMAMQYSEYIVLHS